MARKQQSTIVAATGSAQAGTKGLSKAISEAMARATLEAMAEGVTDPNEIKARKMAAREAVKGAK